MAANAAAEEEIAIAVPASVPKFNRMGVIVTVERRPQLSEHNPLSLSRVSFGLLDLTDHQSTYGVQLRSWRGFPPSGSL